MLTFLITVPRGSIPLGANQMRQQLDNQEHFRRGNATSHPDRRATGPINGDAFLAYVRDLLVPTLSPGDVVIVDNLGSHRGKAVRQAIRQAGAKLIFLPKYSPDLNPIEQVFSKLKHLLRRAQARSYDGLMTAIAELLDTYTPQECANYLQHSGYGVV